MSRAACEDRKFEERCRKEAKVLSMGFLLQDEGLGRRGRCRAFCMDLFIIMIRGSSWEATQREPSLTRAFVLGTLLSSFSGESDFALPATTGTDRVLPRREGS